MRLLLGGMAGALSLVLAGCGSSNSSPTPTPTPTPTSTPTPTPTPTATPTPITYTTSEAALQYSTEGGVQRIANATSVAPAMGTVFAFTPDQNGYTYTLLNGTVAPAPSEAAVFPVASIKDCEITTWLCYGSAAFVFQQVPAGPGTYTLSRYITGPGNPLQALSSVGFGLFAESLQESVSRLLVDLRPFAYGVASPSAVIPTTGTATFRGPLIGQATGNKLGAGTSNVYKLTGSFELAANYAAATATLKLTITGNAVGCTSCSPEIKLTYDSTSGTIASGVLTFALPGGGTARFFLAGGAEAGSSTAAIPPTEVGGSFVLNAADPNETAVTMIVAGSGGGAR